ncbi:MAG TPA: glycosyltransferase family 39 protein, partial [Vicinamibacterales bacterium]|nr:glycosyltransferase family 39 protein [Vicinamibacterales bacterium]
MQGIATTLSLMALTTVGLGSVVGFRASAAYLLFWLLSACVVLASARIARYLFPADSLSGTLIRISTIAFALVVASEMLLGSLGLIRLLPQVVLFSGIYAASCLLPWRAVHPGIAVRHAPLMLLAALAPMVVFIVATGITRSPLTLYDSLSYHLVFPARWLLDHRLSIVPTPFSDEAQAYAPANGELFFLWLMLPFHGDVLARIGQLPFYLLGGVVLYALARRAGATPAHAIYPPLFYFFTRPIVEQALGADVDLICWSLFLASMYFAASAADRDQPRDWCLWGVSVGLYCGTKYVALVYAPILVAFAIQRGLRRRMAWALPGILIFAAPWYVRNWIVGGSPIYPSSIAVAGFTLAQGAYSRHAMLHSAFHTTNVRLF